VISIPPPAATPTAEPSAEPAPEPPAATAEAASPPAPAAAPAPGPVPDLVDSPGDARLDSAARLLKDGKHADARSELTKALPDIERSGSLDARMAAHALLARACAARNDTKCATDQYELVRASWKDPAAATKALDAAGGDDKTKAERLRRALNAMGEALFHAAEEKKLAADKEKFPAYKGNGDKKSVLAYIQTKVAFWLKERTAAIQHAEKAYAAVTQLQPAPPPRWVVASAERVGVMWGTLVAELRASPIPKEWQGSGLLPGTSLDKQQLRADYYAAVDAAAAPQMGTARSAFKTCQDTAQKFGIQDDDSKACDAWLAKNPAPAATP
jgi:hypothetical protein